MRLFVMFVVASLSSVALATAPASVVLSQQGRLLDANDQPVNGQIAMSFRLFDTNNPEEPTPVWHEDATVQVTNGYYSYLLGSGDTPLDTTLSANPLYLSVAIDGIELLPRQRIGFVPYALHAEGATSATTVQPEGVNTDAIQSGAVTLDKLALTDGKFVGLDADTLDGLDSSAFAPSSIETTVTDIDDRAQDLQTTLASIKSTTDAGATQASVDALKSELDAVSSNGTSSAAALDSLSTTASATKSELDTLSTSASATKSELDSVSTTATAMKSELDLVKTASDGATSSLADVEAKLDKLLLRGVYSNDCTGTTGWDNRLDCLADGRWHVLVNAPPTDADKNGVTSGTETCTWILQTVVAQNLRSRSGTWQIQFSYDQLGTVWTGTYRAQDDSNLTLYTADGTQVMTSDNSGLQSCSLPPNGNPGYLANLSVKL